MAEQGAKPDERTIGDIERELAAARARLADNLTLLVDEIHPKAVVHRSIADAKDLVSDRVQAVKSSAQRSFTDVKELTLHRAQMMGYQFRSDDGTWNVRNIVIAAGTVAGTIGLLIVFKAVGQKGAE